ncbi:MAG: hypothetical protein A4E20_10715 [Nitrospira sp. SG-bin2]|nr:MAG: hypothetical protein A4E20_10715 [Nitrospira sp. SG-bin2]
MKDKSALAQGWFRKADSDLADARRTAASEGVPSACLRWEGANDQGSFSMSPRAIPFLDSLSAALLDSSIQF